MNRQNSGFNLIKAKNHISKFNSLWPKEPNFNSYEEFKRQVAPIDGKIFTSYINSLVEAEKLHTCSYGITSGSTGHPKLLANSLWRNQNKIEYARHLKQQLETFVFSKIDVVANLFTAGGFSTLYDGCNRLVEAVGCSLIPIGRFGSFSSQHQKNMLTMMSKLKTNVLLGTPSSIIEILEFSQDCGIGLQIEKIVFTGEPFSQSKRDYVRAFWPKALFFGLYGHSETGFLGFNTPQCNINHYHLLDDWFFVEVGKEEEILVTSYVDEYMPIIRYQVGDKAVLLSDSCQCGIDQPLIALLGRVDKKLNYAGNLIDSVIIEQKIQRICNAEVGFQIQLFTDSLGKDIFTLVLDMSSESMKLIKGSLYKELYSIEDIAEAIDKGAGEINILAKEKFIYSERQKRPVVIDLR